MITCIKRLLLSTLLLAGPAMAQNAGDATGIILGSALSISGSSRGDTLDASSTTRRNAYGFLAPQSGTIDEICVYVNSKTGTLGSTDGVIAIFSDASGRPNSSLSTGTFNPNSTGYQCATMSQAVVGGTQYWFQVTNANGTPGSNFFSIWQGPQGIVGGGANNDTQNTGSSMCRSTDNGSTWTAINRVQSAAYRVHYSAGTYYGFPMQGDDTPTNPVAVADRIYGTAEVANKFTTPAGATLNLLCVNARVAISAGTPTGFLRYGLYSGASKTFVAYTNSGSVVSTVTNIGGLKLCFTSAQALSPSTEYRVSIAETTQANTSSNAYGPHRIDWHNNANSLALKPMQGTFTKSVCASSCNGGTWTDTTTSFYEMQLLLDPTTPFTAPTTVGGVYSRGTSGNLQ